MMDELEQDLTEQGPVLHILVIGFHHKKGYEVNFSHPPLMFGDNSLPEPWAFLPCAALPDGVHNFDEDISIFHLPKLTSDFKEGTETIFGVSCCRQIDSKDLKVKEEGMTRRTVQKSVCVLMHMPLYGLVLSKLSLVTQAYFNELDFSKTEILQDFYTSLNHSLQTTKLQDTIFNVGLSPTTVVTELKQKVLMVFKLLLLQKKVLVWGCPVRNLCTTLITLVSLFPGIFQKGLARSLHTGSHDVGQVSQAPRDHFGLPLDIFGNGYIFHPYLALQQMNTVTQPGINGYLIGASNILFKDQSHTSWDAMIDIECGTLKIESHDIEKLIALTTEDLRFCDYLVKTVTEKGKEEGNTGWEGSDEWVRAQFKMYLLCLLASAESQVQDEEDQSFAFNSGFLDTLKRTDSYRAWQSTEHPGIDAIARQHPFAGEATVNDVRLRLRSMIEEISSNSGSGKKIEEAVIKTGQIVGGAWNSAKGTISSWRGWLSGIGQDTDTEVHSSTQENIDVNGKEVNSNDDELLNQGMSISDNERLGLKSAPFSSSSIDDNYMK